MKKKIIESKVQKKKELIIKELQGIDSLSIMYDGWSSVANKSYLAISAQYVNKSSNLVNRLLKLLN